MGYSLERRFLNMFITNKKDELIQLRVTKDQKKIIKELADKNKMTMTQYIFSLLEKEYKKEN